MQGLLGQNRAGGTIGDGEEYDPKKLERRIHEKLRERKSISENEWFMLDFKILVDIIEETYLEEEVKYVQ